MSHTAMVYIIADQCIHILGEEVNIHDIFSLYINENGTIIGYTTDKKEDKIEK